MSFVINEMPVQIDEGLLRECESVETATIAIVDTQGLLIVVSNRLVMANASPEQPLPWHCRAWTVRYCTMPYSFSDPAIY